MLRTLGLYYRTIKHLKPIQIRYRLWYKLRSRLRKITNHYYLLSIPKDGHPLESSPWPPKPASCNLKHVICFTFLNQSHTFKKGINWNFNKYGKLWAYKLNYFDYLLQENMAPDEGLMLIREFIDQIHENEQGLEPYPVSLRCVNWIKFLSFNKISDKQVDSSLYAQYQILLDNLEYHILGNHLLENGFSLLFGAYYFRDEEMLNRSKQILREQLDEQILEDGAHFERSPMYHIIILERLLDSYNILLNNRSWQNQERLRNFIKNKIEIMLGWLIEITFSNGDIPNVNDSVVGEAPTTKELMNYAKKLEISAADSLLADSGYRMICHDSYELFLDVGDIGPDYLPAHAHSDTFSFILHHYKKPLIIDTGVTTYEVNERRLNERCTHSHNTVLVENEEQSEVWKGFRVGKRAKVVRVDEKENQVRACHDGYKGLGIIHERSWNYRTHHIIINDFLKGPKDVKGRAFIHFHPRVKPYILENSKYRAGNTLIRFEGEKDCQISTYLFSQGFNKMQKAYLLKVSFKKQLTTEIELL